jgi:hypothetical protein
MSYVMTRSGALAAPGTLAICAPAATSQEKFVDTLGMSSGSYPATEAADAAAAG